MTAAPPDANQGIAVLCDRQGTIRTVLRDDLGLGHEFAPGRNLIDVVAAEDVHSAERFLEEIHDHQASFDWRLSGRWRGRLGTLHFTGGEVEGGLLVIAAPLQEAIDHLSQELMLINNEQTNALRTATKELATQKSAARPAADPVYDELTQVNNELANLHRELAKANAELTVLNEKKNQLLGMAAHDLRTPIGVIQTYSEFIETEARDVLDAEQLSFVHTIRETSRFMLDLLNDVLDVATIESGHLTLDIQPDDLAPLIKSNVARNALLAEKKGITVDLQPPPDELLVAMDSTKVEQVLNNLIGNAIKFSQPGSRIEILVRDGAEEVTVAVADHGLGIASEDRDKLFKLFGKIRAKGTSGEKNTGLGLAIVRRIIDAHGGAVSFIDTPGGGATFEFTLPRADNDRDLVQKEQSA